jgi:hypothetical protein
MYEMLGLRYGADANTEISARLAEAVTVSSTERYRPLLGGRRGDETTKSNNSSALILGIK